MHVSWVINFFFEAESWGKTCPSFLIRTYLPVLRNKNPADIVITKLSMKLLSDIRSADLENTTPKI